MKKITVLLILTFVNFSCRSGDDVCCPVVSLDIDIKFEGPGGSNLINQDGGINESGITVYHKIDEVWHVASNQSLLVERDNEPYLRIFLNAETGETNISETLIAFSQVEADTIRAELNKSPNVLAISKVWYNGDLKWDINQHSEPYFTIIK